MPGPAARGPAAGRGAGGLPGGASDGDDGHGAAGGEKPAPDARGAPGEGRGRDSGREEPRANPCGARNPVDEADLAEFATDDQIFHDGGAADEEIRLEFAADSDSTEAASLTEARRELAQVSRNVRTVLGVKDDHRVQVADVLAIAQEWLEAWADGLNARAAGEGAARVSTADLLAHLRVLTTLRCFKLDLDDAAFLQENEPGLVSRIDLARFVRVQQALKGAGTLAGGEIHEAEARIRAQWRKIFHQDVDAKLYFLDERDRWLRVLSPVSGGVLVRCRLTGATNEFDESNVLREAMRNVEGSLPSPYVTSPSPHAISPLVLCAGDARFAQALHSAPFRYLNMCRPDSFVSLAFPISCTRGHRQEEDGRHSPITEVERIGARAAFVATPAVAGVSAVLYRHGDESARVTRIATNDASALARTWIVVNHPASELDTQGTGGVKRCLGSFRDLLPGQVGARFHKIACRPGSPDGKLARLFRVTASDVVACLCQPSIAHTEQLRSLCKSLRHALGIDVTEGSGSSSTSFVPPEDNRKRKRGEPGLCGTTPAQSERDLRHKRFLEILMPRWFPWPEDASAHLPYEKRGLPAANEIKAHFAANCSKTGAEMNGRIESLRQGGLLANRTVPYAVHAVEWIAHIQSSTSEPHDFAAAIHVLRTSSAEGAVATGHAFSTCNTEDEDEFAACVKDPVDRARVLQGAAVLDVPCVILAHVHGDRVVHMTMVMVDKLQSDSWLEYTECLGREYLGFAFAPESPGSGLVRLGADGCAAYGFAREHRTVQAYLRLWQCQRADLLQHGTPPACERLMPRVACFVEITDNAYREARELQLYSHNNPAVVTWTQAVQDIFSAMWRAMQVVRLVDSGALDAAHSVAELVASRAGIMPQERFLLELKRALAQREALAHESGDEASFSTPATKAAASFRAGTGDAYGESDTQTPHVRGADAAGDGKVDDVDADEDASNGAAEEGMHREDDDEAERGEEAFEMSGEEGGDAERRSSSEVRRGRYKRLDDPGLQALRLDTSRAHFLLPNMEDPTSRKPAQRKCVLCCYRCAKNERHVSRVGRSTTKLCSRCKVPICKHCFKAFHELVDVPRPACTMHGMIPGPL